MAGDAVGSTAAMAKMRSTPRARAVTVRALPRKVVSRGFIFVTGDAVAETRMVKYYRRPV